MRYDNTFDGGTNFSNITIANSDNGTSGRAFDYITPNSGLYAVPTYMYTVGQTAHGALNMKNSTGSTQAYSYVQWNVPSGLSVLYTRQYVMISSLPAPMSGAYVKVLGAGSAYVAFTESYLRLGSSTEFFDNVAAGTHYRIETRITSTELMARVYSKDSTTLLDSAVYNHNSGFPTTVWFGKWSSVSGTAYTIYTDSIAIANTTWIGPYGTPARKDTRVKKADGAYRSIFDKETKIKTASGWTSLSNPTVSDIKVKNADSSWSSLLYI